MSLKTPLECLLSIFNWRLEESSSS
jgi:hypothetical protein